MLSSSLIRKCSKCAEQVYTVAFYCGKTMVMESTVNKIAGCRAPNLERESERERARERESERDRQTDRQRQRERQRETDRISIFHSENVSYKSQYPSKYFLFSNQR